MSWKYEIGKSSQLKASIVLVLAVNFDVGQRASFAAGRCRVAHFGPVSSKSIRKLHIHNDKILC